MSLSLFKCIIIPVFFIGTPFPVFIKSTLFTNIMCHILSSSDFGSFEFSSTQPKATSASASVSSSTSLFAAAPSNTTSSVFDSDFKTDSTPAVEERQEEKKEEKKEVETVKAKVDVFSALSVEASQKSAPPIVSTANVHSAYEPPKQEGASTKESVSSLANKLDMMSIDVNQPLPEHLRAVLSRYRALFDFAAEGDDELSFKKGDIILVSIPLVFLQNEHSSTSFQNRDVSPPSFIASF